MRSDAKERNDPSGYLCRIVINVNICIIFTLFKQLEYKEKIGWYKSDNWFDCVEIDKQLLEKKSVGIFEIVIAGK